MRKVLLVLSLLSLLTAAVSTATAQDPPNQITLGPSASNAVLFTGNGAGGWTLTFTPNPLFGFFATGTGTLSEPTTPPWTINQGSVTITGTPTAAAGLFNITQTGGTGFLTFSWGTYLSGDLQLVNLNQTIAASGPPIVWGTIANTNDALVVNLTNLTGSLVTSGLIGTSAILDLTIALDSPTGLSTLGTGTLGGDVSSGEIRQTPEPVSMTLVGSGLVLLGALIRRRRTAQ